MSSSLRYASNRIIKHQSGLAFSPFSLRFSLLNLIQIVPIPAPLRSQAPLPILLSHFAPRTKIADPPIIILVISFRFAFLWAFLSIRLSPFLFYTDAYLWIWLQLAVDSLSDHKIQVFFLILIFCINTYGRCSFFPPFLQSYFFDDWDSFAQLGFNEQSSF